MTGLMRDMTGLEKLRELARKMTDNNECALMQEIIGYGTDGCVGRSCGECRGLALGKIADQIERERNVCDREEHEAASWVREHGGLERVKNLLDWVVGHCSTRQQLDFDFWLSGRVMHELGFEEDMADRGEVERRLLARLMPEGMEWPRFEGGELVRCGDEALLFDRPQKVGFIQFFDTGLFLQSDDNDQQFSYGERVKRPAPKVLDSEGVECNVGDAVWWVLNKTGNFRIIRIEQDGKCAIHDDDADEPCGMTVPSTELTHKRPVIDADGAEIRVGDTVYYVDGREQRVNTVARLTDNGCVQFGTINEAGYVTYCEAACIQPNLLTHRAPVLAADGLPLREGETVYVCVDYPYSADIVKGEAVSVRSAYGSNDAEVVDRKGDVWFVDADQLTHKPFDSWERLEDDATRPPRDYCGMLLHWAIIPEQNDGHYIEGMASDLVRRAKALAGVSE